MKSLLYCLLPVSVFCISCSSNETVSTPASEPEVAAPVVTDSATAVANWMAYGVPGDMHRMLAARAGKWRVQILSPSPDGAVVETGTVTAQYTMVLGGRYLQAMYNGTMMGQPFESTGLTGYDNSKKVFIDTWADNMGTGIIVLEGSYDAATRTLETKGTAVDPINNGTCGMRQVLRTIDDNHMVMEMFTTPLGATEVKTMVMEYERM